MINVMKLKGIMAEKGVTQGMLASELRISENTISNKLNGKRDFTAKEAIEICNYLGIVDPKVKCEIFLP